MSGNRWSVDNLKHDLFASVVVFLVALPLCMGIAIASGVPAEQAAAVGIITGVIGGIVVGLIGGAPLQVSGPAAGLAVIVFDLIQTFGWEKVSLVFVVAGVIQFLAGLARLGQWFRAVSPAVIQGMLAGIGILIFASQFHVMVDDSPKSGGLANLLSIPEAVWKGLIPSDEYPMNHYYAARIGVLTILILALWKPLAPKQLQFLPAPLVAILVASLTVVGVNRFGPEFEIKHVQLPDNFLNNLHLADPSLITSWQEWQSILLAAISVAFIASAETLLSVTAVDKMHRGPRARYDRELTAQGIGNTISGFIGGLPMTGVIVRSAANVQAGARTNHSAILHGIWLVLMVGFFPSVLRLIPTSALGALLVYTGYRLVNINAIRSLWAYSRSEVVIYAVTVITIVTIDLLTGVVAGIALSAMKLLYTFSHLDIELDDQPETGRTILYLRGAATFIRLPKLAETLDKVPANRELHVHFEDLHYIDHACLDLLISWEKQHQSQGGQLVIDWESLTARFRERASANTGKNGAANQRALANPQGNKEEVVTPS